MALDGGSIAVDSSGVLVERSAVLAKSCDHAFITVDLVNGLFLGSGGGGGGTTVTRAMNFGSLLLGSSEV